MLTVQEAYKLALANSPWGKKVDVEAKENDEYYFFSFYEKDQPPTLGNHPLTVSKSDGSVGGLPIPPVSNLRIFNKAAPVVLTFE